ncbi:MAG: TrmH family RNA methyltransferase, partial [Actinomycetes bacterium]
MSETRRTEPTELTAATRNQLRSARRLLQRKERVRREEFLAEGPQAVREALAEPGRVRRLFVTGTTAPVHAELLAAAQSVGAPTSRVTEAELATVTGTVTPQGLVAVCRWPPADLAEALTGARLVAACAAVREPGNAGTVIRCADAFGADAVVLTAGSVDATNPKTVRASVGSLFHLPVVADIELSALVDA